MNTQYTFMLKKIGKISLFFPPVLAGVVGWCDGAG